MDSGTPRPDPPLDVADATVSIDLDALRRNYRTLRKAAGSAVCAAVVKGDAYGVGITATVRTLHSEGCTEYFAAKLSEAEAIRAELGDANIYVLNGLTPDAGPRHFAAKAWPVIGNLEESAEWAALGRDVGEALPAMLHIDTGINRLGLNEGDLDRLIADAGLLRAIKWRGVMSHLAWADQPQSPHNDEQITRFDALRAKLPPLPASLANSAGLLSGTRFHYDLVRPGIALYGGSPFRDGTNPMEQVVSVHAAVAQVREVPVGGGVGYGAIWRAERPSRIAILPVGYGDGFFRSLSNSAAQVWIGGNFAPLAGRVSMDMITVDVTHIAPEKVMRGTVAEIFGKHISVDEFAAWADTISYEVLTSLGPRYERRYESVK
jgi:alanine racemase